MINSYIMKVKLQFKWANIHCHRNSFPNCIWGFTTISCTSQGGSNIRNSTRCLSYVFNKLSVFFASSKMFSRSCCCRSCVLTRHLGWVRAGSFVPGTDYQAVVHSIFHRSFGTQKQDTQPWAHPCHTFLSPCRKGILVQGLERELSVGRPSASPKGALWIPCA